LETIMTWIRKVCVIGAALGIMVLPFAGHAEDPKTFDTETFNPASGGEQKGAAKGPRIPGDIAVAGISGHLSVESDAKFNAVEDSSAPAKSRGDQGAPSELGQK
jgi:hypothetical protein